LDPSLCERGGHHQDQAKYLLAEATAMGLSCMILGNQRAEPDALGLPVLRHFRVSGYGIAKCGKNNENHTLKQNKILLQDLKRLPARFFRRDDLILFPAVTRNQVFGICQWIERLSRQGATTPRFAICLMFPPDSWFSIPSSDEAESIYRQAAACLGQTAQVIWTCETVALAETFKPLIGCRPIVLPVVLLPEMESLAPAPMGSRLLPAEPMISILGHSRAEKGSFLVPEIVERVVQMRPFARFTLHALSPLPQEEDALVKAYRELRPAPRIVRGSIEQQTFIRLLEETDLMLLPYDAESYGQRGSGLANQVAALGIPLVSPAGCAFANTAAQENRAIQFDTYDAKSIATAVVTALDQLGELKENATAIALGTATRPGYLASLFKACTEKRGTVPQGKENLNVS
jgi:glycosyltransferase involved in cell wall biosynthesis